MNPENSNENKRRGPLPYRLQMTRVGAISGMLLLLLYIYKVILICKLYVIFISNVYMYSYSRAADFRRM